ncbi:MAG: glycosyltransferase [Planctomycetaceae bacterium]|nr:glycosyltransferase [Planctomycetaceae bacterium]
MRILFIGSGKSVPSTRFRVLPFAEQLRRRGHRCDVAMSFPEKYDSFRWLGWRGSQLLKRTIRRWHTLLARLRDYDAIVIEREVYHDNTWEREAHFRAAARRLILDVDDGVFLNNVEKFDRISGMCDAVVVGNRYLMEYFQPRCQEVHLIPTCVTLADYQLRVQPPAEHPVTLGWIGTTHNVMFLQECASALRRVALDIPFRLLVVATTDERLGEVDLSGVNVEFRAWDPDREVADLHEMDIGLMPLRQDEPWMKYKCGLKLVQYLAVGSPGIATPIGVNAEILEGGRVGRAATTDEQWETALRELLMDPVLRQQLGQAGRKLVEEQFSIEGNLDRFESILRGSE